MAYGLVNDTTLQAMADGLRNKGIAPTTVKEYYTTDTITHATPNVINMETAEYDGWFDSYTETFIIPDAAKMEVKLVKFSSPDVGASSVGAIYVNDVPYNIWSSYYPDATKMFTHVVDGNTCSVQFLPWGGNSIFGAIIEVRGIDADGNYIEFQEFNEVPNKLTPEEMVDAINSAMTLPTEALNLTGSVKYKFAGDAWNWFLEGYGSLVTTDGVTDPSYMFYNSMNLVDTNIDTINISKATNFDNMFINCYKLQKAPNIRGSITWGTNVTFNQVLDNCRSLRNIDDLFTDEMFEGYSNIKFSSGRYSVIKPVKLNYMYSLRSIPSWFYKQKQHPDSTSYPSQTYALFYSGLRDCYALDEAINLPVIACASTLTDDQFKYGFNNLYRAKRITFETNPDGSPIVTQWKSQVIDLLTGVGHTNGNAAVLKNYNTGITADKEVTDADTYAALKDDPDWFTNLNDYSRFNHDSAVALINSLPDTSAYLATAGGTNTLKLKGTAGSLTDGGAINNLTEAEIAVATAKGWTVTIS